MYPPHPPGLHPDDACQLVPPPAFENLKKDLESAALTQCNFPLFSNGASGRHQTRRFKCGACMNRVKSKKYMASRMNMKMSPGGMPSSLLVNDRSNSRKDGKTRSRRTTTTVGDKSCTFGFAIRWDTIGFFISLARNSGCAKHKYHIRSYTPPTSVPTRLLADDARETMEHLAAACCTTGVGQSYLMSKLGRYMSNSKIAYMYSGNDAEQGLSEYDHLTKYFEQAEDIAYTVLWDAYSASPILSGGSFLSAGGTILAAEDDRRRDNLPTTTVPYSTPPAAGRPLSAVTSCLLSHTKFDNVHSCTKDHSKDDSLIGLRQENRKGNKQMRTTDKDLYDIGLTQSTFDPDGYDTDANSSIDDMSSEECDDDKKKPNGGVMNLFQESSLKCNATTGGTERPSHDDDGKDFSKDLQAIGSLYWTVGKLDRDMASKSIATLLAQLRCASLKQKKRNGREDMTSGTHGIVEESLPKRSRTFVTHHDYYRK